METLAAEIAYILLLGDFHKEAGPVLVKVEVPAGQDLVQQTAEGPDIRSCSDPLPLPSVVPLGILVAAFGHQQHFRALYALCATIPACPFMKPFALSAKGHC